MSDTPSTLTSIGSWISSNWEILFGGVGTALALEIIRRHWRRTGQDRKISKKSQKAGKGSIQIQADDIYIGGDKKEK